jgi:hypothetical protein
MHKEGLLATVIKRALPDGIIASRGFVVDECDVDSCSKEVDILLLDTTSVGPFFHEHDLVIGMASQALGAISVKTRFNKKQLSSVVENLCPIHSTARGDSRAGHIWTGGFFFYDSDGTTEAAVDPVKVLGQVREAIGSVANPTRLSDRSPLPCGPHMLAVGQDLCILIEYAEAGAASVRGYRCQRLSFGAFIAALLDHVAAVRGGGLHPLARCIDELEFVLVEEET